jgi:hypothetical protein
MTDLTPDKLREMAGKIQALLDEFEIENHGFTLQLHVPGEYLQAIKGNFPYSPIADLILGVLERWWAIHIHHNLVFDLESRNSSRDE